MSVRFERGISIISVSPISVSSSSIIIENVPLDTTMSTLQTLVRPFKPTISPHAIRITTREDSLRVIIHFDDTVAADEAIKGLVGTEIDGRALVAKALKPTAASQDIAKIECSWYPATASAILRLESKAAATELIQLSTLLDTRIRGRRVKAIAQSDRVGRLAAVLLVNLDPATTEEEILTQFPCISILLRQPKYDLSKDDTLQYIRQKFEVDRAEDLRITSGPAEPRLRAMITFASANDARAVYEKVKASNDEMFNKMNFTYSLKYSVHFRVHANTWKAVKGEINKLVHEENERERNMRENGGVVDGENAPARVNITEPRGGFAPVNVHIHGGGRPAVVKIKGAIQKLLNGKTVCDTEGKPLWDAALRGVEGRRLVQLVVDSGVHVHVDYRTRSVTLYGSPDKIIEAEEIMKEQYALLLTMQHELSLEGDLERLALQGGIAAVQEHLGEEMVQVDHANRRVFVHCSPADIGYVKTLLYKPRRRRAQLQTHGPAATVDTAKQAEDACPVCMESADPPVVKLSCGHTYCKACLHGFVKATIDGRKFPINCFHTSEDGHTCATPLSISTILEILSKSDSEQLFETAFTTYIQARPKEYSYCPTPDCPTVYKVTTTESFITCSQCLVGICTACKIVAHNGQTCAQYKAVIEAETDFQDWTRRAGVKKCPKCHVNIEKNDGCNHMRCICGAHLCWHCMKEFDVGRIYTHMSQECGGTFTNPEPVEDPGPAPRLAIPPPYERDELMRLGLERVERIRARERIVVERAERAERDRTERERVQRLRESAAARERIERERAQLLRESAARRAQILRGERERAENERMQQRQRGFEGHFWLASEEARRMRRLELEREREREAKNKNSGWSCVVM